MSKTEKVVEIKMAEDKNYIPAINPTYVPWGCYELVSTAIKSKRFMPIYITGLSGNGKTMTVEQACARENREYFRMNFTRETDRVDMIGSIGLKDGNTVWEDGIVITAMRRGGVLLLDEVDLASPNVMALQSILEGRGYLIKETGEHVIPKEGFTIFATANTKGQGSDDGRFIGANVQKEALLDRFDYTIEQPYPDFRQTVRVGVDENGLQDGTYELDKLLDSEDERTTFEMSSQELVERGIITDEESVDDMPIVLRLEQAILYNVYYKETGYFDKTPEERMAEYEKMTEEEINKSVEESEALHTLTFDLTMLAHRNRVAFGGGDSSTQEQMDDVLTTRRLCAIIRAYIMFGDVEKAIKLSISRFDSETQSAIMKLYKSIKG